MHWYWKMDRIGMVMMKMKMRMLVYMGLTLVYLVAS